MPSSKCLVLNPEYVLKILEKPVLYRPSTDEFFELDQKGFNFLKDCASKKGESYKSKKSLFLDYCLQEGILKISNEPQLLKFPIQKSPIPSLRYLLLHITDRCNLRCKHCYMGEPSKKYLPFKVIIKVLIEFEKMQGLRLMITGGEPLLHPHFWEINKILPQFKFRKILLTNGLLLNRKNIEALNFNEIQISLDGLEASHNALRGKGTFKRAVAALRMLKNQDFYISVSTMVHSRNLENFEKLKKFLKTLGIAEWCVDVPCPAGRFKENQNFSVPPKIAAQYLKYGFGPEGHPSFGKYGCGTHLMAVMPDGRTDKCGYFVTSKSPKVTQGLKYCFKSIPKIKLIELKCRGCEFILECRGGCRARAKNLLDRDLYMCYLYRPGGERSEN